MGHNRRGTKSVTTLRALLTDRDQAILQSIFDHKFLTTRQIYDLHFHAHASYASGIRACTRVLTRLNGHKLIYRLDRPVGGAGGGSTSHTWGIDAAGDRLMKTDLAPDDLTRARAFEPTSMFLTHTLAIADARITLEQLARTSTLELVEVVTEPGNWRPFLGPNGKSQTLKPDLYSVTATAEFEDHWFLEVDRGTESIPALIRKCLIYQRYRATGHEQDTHHVFPLVLWLIPHSRRRARLRDAIAAEKRLDPPLFKIINPDNFAATISGDSTSKNGPTGPTMKGGNL